MIIFGKKDCKNCSSFRDLCIKNNKEFEYRELGVDFEREQFDWFFEDVEIKEFPVLRYKGMLVSYHLFNKTYLNQFLNELL